MARAAGSARDLARRVTSQKSWHRLTLTSGCARATERRLSQSGVLVAVKLTCASLMETRQQGEWAGVVKAQGNLSCPVDSVKSWTWTVVTSVQEGEKNIKSKSICCGSCQRHLLLHVSLRTKTVGGAFLRSSGTVERFHTHTYTHTEQDCACLSAVRRHGNSWTNPGLVTVYRLCVVIPAIPGSSPQPACFPTLATTFLRRSAAGAGGELLLQSLYRTRVRCVAFIC